MFAGPIADRLALRELLDSYSDAVNRLDADAWAATWSDDARWLFRGSEVIGREAIVATWRDAMARFDAVWFSAFPGMIDIDGDEATMRSHTLEYLAPAGAAPKLQYGIYEDRAVRAGEGWRFAVRAFTPREIKL